MSQRKQFIEASKISSKPFSHLCEEYGISRITGYKWLKRYKSEGYQGLRDQRRSPNTQYRKISPALESKILEVRARHPYWGARKLRALLMRQGQHGLPSVSTVHSVLKRNGCVSHEASIKNKALCRFERATPNELWQMDFKGHFQLGLGKPCYPLTILDDHSRFSVCLRACANEQRVTVHRVLEEVFREYGLPEQINVDNGNPWGNSDGHRHTHLTVWLMRLGIIVSHSRPYHPQTNGKDERFHRTLKTELLNFYSLREILDFDEAQQLFDPWRRQYNYERPHEALGMQVPAERYKQSHRLMPKKLLDLEYGGNALLRKVRGNGFVSYKHKEYLFGKAFSGFYVEVRPDESEERIDLYFGRNKIHSYPVM